MRRFGTFFADQGNGRFETRLRSRGALRGSIDAKYSRTGFKRKVVGTLIPERHLSNAGELMRRNMPLLQAGGLRGKNYLEVNTAHLLNLRCSVETIQPGQGTPVG